MDVSQYLSVFMDECNEHIQALNQALLELEETPDDSSVLDRIFRSAHTLKGASATMGFNKMSTLTHAMEDLLSKLRDKELEMNPKITNALFEAVDLLELLSSKISEGKEEDIETAGVIQTLRSFIISGGGQAPPVEERRQKKLQLRYLSGEKDDISAAINNGAHFYHFTVEMAENCVLKGARAFMALREFEKQGTIVKSMPTMKELEDENFENQFMLGIISMVPPEEIHTTVANIFDIEKVTFEELAVDDLPVEKRVQSSTPTHVKGVGQTVRVDIKKMDELMNLVAELVISRSRLENISSELQSKDLDEVLEQFGRLTMNLRDNVLKARMIPVETILSRFPRLVRDLAKDLDKDIDVEIQGGETELDRTVIDEIGDPLLHIIRNSVDHGIESRRDREASGKDTRGKIIIHACQEGNSVVITITDDGRGFDLERVKEKALNLDLVTQEVLGEMTTEQILDLTFKPGFSTASKVSDISGRGVGMDVVKTKVTGLGGLIRINTEKGKGSQIEIRLPLTLAIIQTLMVKVGQEVYAIPSEYIEQVVSLHHEDIKKVRNQQFYMLRDELIPIIKLQEVFDIEGAINSELEEIDMVVLKAEDHLVGCVVDTMLRQQDVVIKPLGSFLGSVKGIAGATILGDGTIALIIDIKAVA